MTVEATILPSSGRRQATVALMIATAMQAFDSTIANVALPQLQQSLGGGLDLGSWVMRIFVLNLPLGVIAIAGLGQVPATSEPSRETRIDGLGILLLIVGVGSLQLSLERSIGQTWPPSPEIVVEATVAVLALSVIAVRSL